MNPIILNNIPFEPDTDKIADKLHIEKDSDDYADYIRLLESAKEVAIPKALYMPLVIEQRGSDFVVLDGRKMSSGVMCESLMGVPRLFVFVSTCGEEIEALSKTVTDILHSWWMERIKEQVLACASAYLKQRIVADMGLSKIASIHPGALPDWPLSEQAELFALLGDTQQMLGVTLSDSMLMDPAKSLSGFMFEATGE